MKREIRYIAEIGLTGAALAWAVVSRRRAAAAAGKALDSEKRYRVLVESAPAAICVHRAGRVLYANPAAVRLFRARDAADLTGRPVLDFIHPDAVPVVVDRLRKLDAGEEVPTLEERMVTLDGDVRDVEARATPIRYEGKAAVQVIMRDVTDRRRAQATLRQSLSLLRATLESTADGILVVDGDGRIVIFNQKFADLWGLPDVVLDARDDQAALSAVVSQLADPAGFLARIREIYARPDDESFDVIELGDGRVFERYSQPQRIGGITVGRVWSFRDVTERRRAAQALEDLAARLIHAQEEERSRIGRELHDHVSQQLALMAIRLDQLRLDPTAPPEMAGAVGRLRQDASEAIEDVYRISHRLHSSALEQLGLVRALERLVAEFSERHGISIGFAAEPFDRPVPPEQALCLFRVVEEALTNVARHSAAATAAVKVEADDEGIRIAVEDTGTGFDPDGGGTGASLGLVSMRERMRIVRGAIRIHSSPSSGTRIEAWAPWGVHPDGMNDDPTADPAGRRSPADGRSPAAPAAG